MGSAPEAARDFLLPLPGIPTACGNGKWEVSQDLSELRSGRKMRTTGRPALAFHPFVRSAPSFHPDLRAARAGARSGGQGWPVFGPPRQRRAASLTAASTTACSIVSGLRSLYATNKPSKGVRERPSKNELMLTVSKRALALAWGFRCVGATSCSGRRPEGNQGRWPDTVENLGTAIVAVGAQATLVRRNFVSHCRSRQSKGSLSAISRSVSRAYPSGTRRLASVARQGEAHTGYMPLRCTELEGRPQRS